MPAYSEAYLLDAMENLGEMADTAVSILNVPLDRFWPLFTASNMARKMASGSPFTVVGRSGFELAISVCEQAGLNPDKTNQLISRGTLAMTDEIEKSAFLQGLSRSYWCGWILGFYQWRVERSFREIERGLPIVSVERMYPTFHEEAEERFCEAADEIIAANSEANGLKRQRSIVGLSQMQLARRSGVGLRAIQQYEQGAKSIAKASFERIERLSHALHCEPHLLLNSVPHYEYGITKFPDD